MFISLTIYVTAFYYYSELNYKTSTTGQGRPVLVNHVIISYAKYDDLQFAFPDHVRKLNRMRQQSKPTTNVSLLKWSNLTLWHFCIINHKNREIITQL